MVDMTTGKPIKKILIFMIPILIGNLFQQFYNMADMIIVGNILGDDSLAAIGVSAPIYSLFIGLIFGITSGFSIVIAKYVGANQWDKVRKAVGQSFVLMVFFSIILTIIVILFLPEWLLQLNTPTEVFDDAYQYISVILTALFITFIYNTLAGILRGIGNSKAPLLFVIISSILNIVMDYLFVAIFKTGIVGAAYATVIAQIISVILCFVYIIKKCPMLKVTGKDIEPDIKIMKELLGMGFSMGFMYSIVYIGTIVLQTAINGLGTTIVTAHIAARKADEFFMTIGAAISATMATYAAQNMGAGKVKRIREGMKSSLLVMFAYSIVITGITYLFGDDIIKLMSGTSNVEIIKNASDYLKLNVTFFPVLWILLVVRSVLQGMGHGFIPVCASSLELIGKIMTAFLLVRIFGYFGIIICEPIIWTIGAIFVSVFFIILVPKEKEQELVS